MQLTRLLLTGRSEEAGTLQQAPVPKSPAERVCPCHTAQHGAVRQHRLLLHLRYLTSGQALDNAQCGRKWMAQCMYRHPLQLDQCQLLQNACPIHHCTGEVGGHSR